MSPTLYPLSETSKSLCDSKQKYFAKMRGQHNNTWTTPGYFDKMKHFLHEDCKNRHVSLKIDYSQSNIMVFEFKEKTF